MRDELAPLKTDHAIRALTRQFIDGQLPAQDWTHAAHFAAALCLHREHYEVDILSDLKRFIRAHNEAVGTPNSDTEGYHETLTQFYARLVAHVCDRLSESTMAAQLNAIMACELGERAFPMRFWRRETLFSVEARRNWVEPDLAPLDFSAIDQTGSG